MSDEEALRAVLAVRPLMLKSGQGGGHVRDELVFERTRPALPALRNADSRPGSGRRQPDDLLVPRMPGLIRVGHKGADHVAPGNTIESFEAALEHGVDMIEFDVLRTRDGRLVLAHDYEDAEKRECVTLEEGLEHFAGEAYAGVELDVDLKLHRLRARGGGRAGPARPHRALARLHHVSGEPRPPGRARAGPAPRLVGPARAAQLPALAALRSAAGVRDRAR